MTGKIVPAAILILVLALVAGCTAPGGGGGGVTPTPTRTPVTLPVTPVVTIPPGPVVTVPPNYDIQIQVTRNPNTAFPYITVAFRGGYGQIYLQELTATVARSDGQVIQEVVPKTGGTQYAVGDSVNIDGTTGTDEVVVVATLNGVEYKIYDEYLPFYTVKPPP
jgi:hypothetical protein